jgi:4-hydroxybenzoate polyprenyltransferase
MDTRVTAMVRTWPRILHAYLRLPHAVPIVAVLLATFGFAVLAADGLPTFGRLAEVLGAMLGAQIAIGAVNELVDAAVDAEVKPEKPIPAGLVTVRGASVLTLLAVAAMLWFGARLGWLPLLLCVAGTATGIAYSLWFKRSRLAWLPYLVALPLLPIWVFAALDEFDWHLPMLYPLGAFAILAVHLAQSLPDVDADRRSGVHNLTSALGEGRSFALCLGSMLLSLSIAAGAAVIWLESAAVVLMAAVLSLGLLSVDTLLYVKHPPTGVKACFPCVASATVVLGLAWVFAAGG